MISSVLLILLGLCVAVQAFYCLYYFLPLWFYKDPESKTQHPVSVLVCGYNEYDNWQALIPLLLQQVYSKFELIFIDDRSTDESRFYLAQVAQEFPMVKIVTVKNTPAGFSPKKYALTLGIKVAQYEHLLFTDTDCRPVSDQWIAGMMSGYEPGASIVLGYSPYNKVKGFLNQLIRFETLLTAIQYLSFAVRGNAYMGVGRNLSYTKSLYYHNKGFASHIKSLGGDDDLFVGEAAENQKVSVVINPASFMLSRPKERYTDWITQKIRHLAAGRHYKTKHKGRIGIFILANIVFYVTSIVLLSIHEQIAWLGVIVGLRLLIVLPVYTLLARKLNEKFSLLQIAVLDVIFFCNYVYLGLSVLMFKKVKWK